MEAGCSIYDRSTTFRPNRWLGPPKYGYCKDGKSLLTKERKLLVNDNNACKYAQTFLEYPPMQEGASFNMSALKAQLEA